MDDLTTLKLHANGKDTPPIERISDAAAHRQQR